jgi:hypothetical protein
MYAAPALCLTGTCLMLCELPLSIAYTQASQSLACKSPVRLDTRPPCVQLEKPNCFVYQVRFCININNPRKLLLWRQSSTRGPQNTPLLQQQYFQPPSSIPMTDTSGAAISAISSRQSWNYVKTNYPLRTSHGLSPCYYFHARPHGGEIGTSIQLHHGTIQSPNWQC